MPTEHRVPAHLAAALVVLLPTWLGKNSIQFINRALAAIISASIFYIYIICTHTCIFMHIYFLFLF